MIRVNQLLPVSVMNEFVAYSADFFSRESRHYRYSRGIRGPTSPFGIGGCFTHERVLRH